MSDRLRLTQRPATQRFPRRTAHNHLVRIISAQGDASERALGGIVGQTDAAVLQEAAEGPPAGEHVVHGFGDGGVSGELGALGAHPGSRSARIGWLSV